MESALHRPQSAQTGGRTPLKPKMGAISLSSEAFPWPEPDPEPKLPPENERSPRGDDKITWFFSYLTVSLAVISQTGS